MNWLEESKEILKKHFKQDIELNLMDLKGMIVVFGFEYNGNKYTTYQYNQYAYCSGGSGIEGFMHTFCLYGDGVNITEDITRDRFLVIDLEGDEV